MMNPKRRDALVLFGILFWILFVLGGYYYYHKPITVEMIAAPALGVFDLFFALLFAGVAGGTGRRLLRDGNLSALELAVLQFALGS